jgi:transcriptional regulator with XRE-family HTH domain
LAKFGRRVRELREATRLSQEALADRANLHRTYIGGVERGERNVGLINIVRIARALDVDAEVLLRGLEDVKGGV